jgi:hypothetical protein
MLTDSANTRFYLQYVKMAVLRGEGRDDKDTSLSPICDSIFSPPALIRIICYGIHELVKDFRCSLQVFLKQFTERDVLGTKAFHKLGTAVFRVLILSIVYIMSNTVYKFIFLE